MNTIKKIFVRTSSALNVLNFARGYFNVKYNLESIVEENEIPEFRLDL